MPLFLTRLVVNRCGGLRWAILRALEPQHLRDTAVLVTKLPTTTYPLTRDQNQMYRHWHGARLLLVSRWDSHYSDMTAGSVGAGAGLSRAGHARKPPENGQDLPRCSHQVQQ